MTMVTIAFCALCIAAGNWQRGRAEEKLALQQKLEAWEKAPPVEVPASPLDAEAPALRPVVVTGTYDEARTILIDNKVYRGRAGFHVVSPLRIGDSDMYVLVNRGWIAGDPGRAALPRFPTPQGVQRVQGVAVVPSARVFELGEAQSGPVWQNLVLDRYAAWSKLKLQPFVIQQTGEAHDGLVRDWPRPDTGADKHRIYAMQWYLFAAVSVILYVVLNLKRHHG